MSKRTDVGVLGGGPAGLKAAETALQGGAKVTVYEGKRSVGRKFLIAGKSGLNLTNDAPIEDFVKAYRASTTLSSCPWPDLLAEFDNTATRAWARELGIETFVSSGKKVFPEQMKAAPLLRRWVESLKRAGVQFRTQHTLSGISPSPSLTLQHQRESYRANHDHVILALGGSLLAHFGFRWSVGANATAMGYKGINSAQPISAEVDWPLSFSSSEGMPLKNIVVSCGPAKQQGELVLTRYGVEAGLFTGWARKYDNTTRLTSTSNPLSANNSSSGRWNPKRNILKEAEQRWKLAPLPLPCWPLPQRCATIHPRFSRVSEILPD